MESDSLCVNKVILHLFLWLLINSHLHLQSVLLWLLNATAWCVNRTKSRAEGGGFYSPDDNTLAEGQALVWVWASRFPVCTVTKETLTSLLRRCCRPLKSSRRSGTSCFSLEYFWTHSCMPSISWLRTDDHNECRIMNEGRMSKNNWLYHNITHRSWCDHTEACETVTHFLRNSSESHSFKT